MRLEKLRWAMADWFIGAPLGAAVKKVQKDVAELQLQVGTLQEHNQKLAQRLRDFCECYPDRIDRCDICKLIYGLSDEYLN